MMWQDNNEDVHDQAMQIVERFTDSELYANICNDAAAGCTDSVEALEHLALHLGSLCFHLEHNSGGDRIQYELEYLRSYVTQWFEHGDQ